MSSSAARLRPSGATLRAVLAGLPGVDVVLDREAQAAVGLDHERSGELIAVAEPDAWFTYYYWTDDGNLAGERVHAGRRERPQTHGVHGQPPRGKQVGVRVESHAQGAETIHGDAQARTEASARRHRPSSWATPTT